MDSGVAGNRKEAEQETAKKRKQGISEKQETTGKQSQVKQKENRRGCAWQYLRGCGSTESQIKSGYAGGTAWWKNQNVPFLISAGQTGGFIWESWRKNVCDSHSGYGSEQGRGQTAS